MEGEGGSAWSLTLDVGDTTQQRVEGLMAGAAYNFQVAAINRYCVVQERTEETPIRCAACCVLWKRERKRHPYGVLRAVYCALVLCDMCWVWYVLGAVCAACCVLCGMSCILTQTSLSYPH